MGSRNLAAVCLAGLAVVSIFFMWDRSREWAAIGAEARRDDAASLPDDERVEVEEVSALRSQRIDVPVNSTVVEAIAEPSRPSVEATERDALELPESDEQRVRDYLSDTRWRFFGTGKHKAAVFLEEYTREVLSLYPELAALLRMHPDKLLSELLEIPDRERMKEVFGSGELDDLIIQERMATELYVVAVHFVTAESRAAREGARQTTIAELLLPSHRQFIKTAFPERGARLWAALEAWQQTVIEAYGGDSVASGRKDEALNQVLRNIWPVRCELNNQIALAIPDELGFMMLLSRAITPYKRDDIIWFSEDEDLAGIERASMHIPSLR